ncbi:hypothetical protein [Roseobacter sp. S98]|uniref:hypothetical protein n=1 Tax=Roseobacter algicola (ex Choi et al. 2025) (nom. illeg.) TaxID=3092138 RepID=UPI003F51345A
MANEPTRMTREEMLRLAGSGVNKVDLLGPRGTTLCTMNEIEAMAMVIVLSGVLPGRPDDPDRQALYPQIEKDKR